MRAKNFRELRAWQTAYHFKLRIYELIEEGPLSQDERLHTQLRDGVASAPAQIAEGFGRFDPLDFARFVKMARASILECQNHLQDAVDRNHITEQLREAHDKLAREALIEIGGLLDYLQSPEAKRNADRIRQKRQERRNRRKREQREADLRKSGQRNPEQPNSEQPNPEQPNSEQPNGEPGTSNA